MPSGLTIVIPALPGAPKNVKQRAASTGEDEVAILINGARFRFWTAVRVDRVFDGFDSFTFQAPMESGRADFREALRPFEYRTVEITVGGTPLFTGVLVSIEPSVSENDKTVTVSGYSSPGVLADCTPPGSAFPLEYNDVTLRQVLEGLAAPFGLEVKDEVSNADIFERVACDPGRALFPFLSDLARQRNTVLSNDENGALTIRQTGAARNVVAKLKQGVPPVTSVTSSFSPQQYYSTVTALSPTLVGLEGEQASADNAFLNVVRPHTFNAQDTDTTAQQAADAKLSRMFANVASYTVTVPTWRTENGALWRPGDTIVLEAPDAMVYTEYAFLVRAVSFSRDTEGYEATLTLVLPGAFSGEKPETLPWAE